MCGEEAMTESRAAQCEREAEAYDPTRNFKGAVGRFGFIAGWKRADETNDAAALRALLEEIKDHLECTVGFIMPEYDYAKKELMGWLARYDEHKNKTKGNEE